MEMPDTTIENLVKISSKLDNLLDRMEIVDVENKLPPLLHAEKVVVKIQLLVAQIIARDISTLQNDSKKKSSDALIKKLTKNWSANISDFTKIILANPIFQINVDQILDNPGEIH